MIRIGCLLLFAFVLQNLKAQSPAPTNVPPPTRADSLFFRNNWKGAHVAYQTYLKQYPDRQMPMLRLALTCIRLNKPDEAIANLQKVIAQTPAAAILSAAQSRLAMAYALKNDKKTAFDCLQKAYTAGYVNVHEMDTDAAYAKLRSDPRFKTIYDSAYAAAYPCAGDPRARAFDFWVGEWEVYVNGSQQRSGTSSIQNVAGSCLILENWTTWNGPFNGKSMNFYDPATNQWKQIWTDSQRNLTYFENGEYKDGAMRFTVANTDRQQGQFRPGRLTFYNLGPNKVRQYFETSSDGGKTYQVSYDFIYVRKGTNGE